MMKAMNMSNVRVPDYVFTKDIIMTSFRTVVSSVALLAILICCAPLHADEYRIDSQERFEVLREASFSPGDTILFKKGLAFDGMFSPSGSGFPSLFVRGADPNLAQIRVDGVRVNDINDAFA